MNFRQCARNDCLFCILEEFAFHHFRKRSIDNFCLFFAQVLITSFRPRRPYSKSVLFADSLLVPCISRRSHLRALHRLLLHGTRCGGRDPLLSPKARLRPFHLRFSIQHCCWHWSFLHFGRLLTAIIVLSVSTCVPIAGILPFQGMTETGSSCQKACFPRDIPAFCRATLVSRTCARPRWYCGKDSRGSVSSLTP